MISFIRGELAWLTENSVVLDCNGIGYEVFVPDGVLARQPRKGEELTLYTHLQVREDGVSLFGFLSREELKMFRLLIGVSGIGPKGAIGILSAVPVDDLRFAVLSEDEKTIARAPGIGAKTAKKLILELKDKFRLEEAFEKKLEVTLSEQQAGGAGREIVFEAVQALTALGFSGTEANRAVHAVELTPDMTSDDLLKAALKKL